MSLPFSPSLHINASLGDFCTGRLPVLQYLSCTDDNEFLTNAACGETQLTV